MVFVTPRAGKGTSFEVEDVVVATTQGARTFSAVREDALSFERDCDGTVTKMFSRLET